MRKRALALPFIFALLIVVIYGLKGQDHPPQEDGNNQTGAGERQILFFQGSAHCEECQVQAEEIEKLKKRIPGIETLSYDVDRDRLVADRYNVWVVPTVIVNGKKHEGLVTADRLESILEGDGSQDPGNGTGLLHTFPLGFSLAAGLLTGLEPCALTFSGMVALLIIGSTVTERRSSNLIAASIFALTRAGIFASFGFAVAALGASAGDLRFVLLIAASAIAFFVGCSYLGWIDLPIATLAPSSKTLLKLRRGHLTPILLGLVFGFAVLPCATPVMASLLAFVATSQRTGLAVASLFLFGAGLSTPVIAFGYLGKAFGQKTGWILEHAKKLSIALGLSFVALSLYLLYTAF